MVVLLAVVIGAAFGTLIGAVALVVVHPGAPDIIGQKSISLRYHLAEILPEPNEPALIPTPLFEPTLLPTPTLLPEIKPAASATPSATRAPTRTTPLRTAIAPIQSTVMLHGIKQDYQRWNNCGPTTLEMDLSFYGRADTQAEIAAYTKPNPDDRNVRPDELAAYATRAGLHAVVGINGTVDLLKLFMSNGVPVMVETALVKEPQGWMGHYRLLNGYDATQFNTMDSYDGPNLKITFADLDDEWRAFNRLYLVVYSDALEARVRAIAPDAFDPPKMYADAVTRARAETEANPQDAFAQFNLGSSLVGQKRYPEGAAAFDRARLLGLPWRMMWYQFGPYEAYLHTGRNDEVLALADSLLKVTDDLEESHYYKGLALRALGRNDEARSEFETALRFNSNYRDAQRALNAS